MSKHMAEITGLNSSGYLLFPPGSSPSASCTNLQGLAPCLSGRKLMERSDAEEMGSEDGLFASRERKLAG